mgnify:CR=1 FL=1
MMLLYLLLYIGPAQNNGDNDHSGTTVLLPNAYRLLCNETVAAKQ